MSRMHSGGKGRSGSSKPGVSEAPAWSESDKNEVEELIVRLAQEGNSTAMIGTILRDQHAVPALSLIDHLSANKKDLHNRRQLELCESKIRRLASYYKGTGRIDEDWVYKQDQLRLMVE